MTKTITFTCDLCNKEIHRPTLTLIWNQINPLDNEAYYCEDCSEKLSYAIGSISKKNEKI